MSDGRRNAFHVWFPLHRGESDIQQMAAELVDRYFGEDYGLDD